MYDLPAPHAVDIDAYFNRIGYGGSASPTKATLDRIVELHTRTIPFENFDVLLGRRIQVDAASVEAKLVGQRRGGYCFEQNTLLLHVLLGLGFDVRPISARVRYQKPRDLTPPRSHLCLIVRIDGEDWLADVGVGGLSLTCALRLVLDEPQETPHDTRRLVSAGDWRSMDQRAPDAVLYHQARLGEAWEDVAEFTLETMHPVDVEMANWFTNMHPQSHFRDRLTVARSTEEGRLTIVNRELRKRGRDGQVATRALTGDAELLRSLKDEFGLELPAGTRFVDPVAGGHASLVME